MSRLLTVGEKLMGGLAKITGVSMLSQFASFLVLMQEVIEGFHSVGNKVLKTLSKRSTKFFMVVSAAEDRMPGVEQFWTQLSEMGYSVSSVFANRCLSTEMATELDKAAKELVTEHLQTYLDRLELQTSILGSLENLSKREAGCEVYKVEDLVGDIDNIQIFSKYIQSLSKL